MAISWNEIKDRALKFSNEWADETKERAEKDSFWNDFFNVFGISRRRVATFEEPVKKLSGNQGFIDLFWKGTLLVEHKSKGKNLDKAYEQATDYFPGLKEHELPKYIFYKKSGPEHQPLFKTEVQIPNSKKILGTGTSKKNAQQSAAAKLIKILKI